MILCHLIDDFTLQPAILSKLKQKEFWKDLPRLYRNDYKIALFLHSLEWSIMIHLPIIFLCENCPDCLLFWSVLVNSGIHSWVDDLKANRKKISLVVDQSIHFLQIIITCFVWIS